MKFKITKDEYDALSDELKALYKSSADGYQLSVEGMPEGEDTTGLKNKINELMDEKKSVSRELQDLQAKIEANSRQKAEDDKDIDSLKASFQAQIDELQGELNRRDEDARKSKEKSIVTELASELAGQNAALIAPHIAKRIRVDDGKVIVTDDNGGATISTLDHLKDEFRKNPLYAPVLSGSGASGSGANGSNGGAGGRDPNKKFNDYSAAELSAIRKENPEEYKRLRDDFYS